MSGSPSATWSMRPKLVSLPVAMPDATHATLALSFTTNAVLKPGQTLDTFDSFVAVHQRDYFQSFQDYSAVMQRRGVKFDPAPESAFGAHLVRLGIRKDVHAGAGGAGVAGSQEARFRLGGSG